MRAFSVVTCSDSSWILRLRYVGRPDEQPELKWQIGSVTLARGTRDARQTIAYDLAGFAGEGPVVDGRADLVGVDNVVRQQAVQHLLYRLGDCAGSAHQVAGKKMEGQPDSGRQRPVKLKAYRCPFA